MALREVVEADGRRDNEEAARQAKVLIRDKASAPPTRGVPLLRDLHQGGYHPIPADHHQGYE